MADAADWTDNPFAAPAEEAAPFNDPSVSAALGQPETRFPTHATPYDRGKKVSVLVSGMARGADIHPCHTFRYGSRGS